MKKSLANLLAVTSMLHTDEYDGPIIDDKQVLDCIMSMYFYLLLDENDPKINEYFENFDKQFQALNEKQKTIVQKDFESIIKAQEKEFIKKKNKKPE